ncbi:hypothetical protein Q7P37_011455 [Cladosporium fusiforme]
MFRTLLSVGALASLALGAPTKDGNLEARQAGVPGGNACGPVHYETRLVDDGSPKQWIYEVQLTRGLRCTDAECSISREEVKSREISASFSIDGGSWISGDFSVTESTSTGETNSCPADSDRDRVCIWDEVDHTEYTVQDWKTEQTASSCSNWIKDGDEYTITSPNKSNEGDVVCKWEDECQSQGATNWVEKGTSTAMEPKTLTQLSNELQQQASNYRQGDEHHRQKLLQLATDLVTAIETPKERIARMCYVEVYLFVTCRILIDLDIFRLISSEKTTSTVDRLAEKSGADPVLLGRLLKHICTQNFVKEVGPDEYLANDITNTLATPEGQGVVVDMFNMYRIGDKFPTYLKERKYRNPINKDDSPWKYGMDTNDHYFEWISRPGREFEAEAFHNHMRFKTLGLKWHEMPNILESVFGSANVAADEVLMVDVGGGSGHDLVSFRDNHSNIPGRLVLQDLPRAIEAAEANGELKAKGIEACQHDFFTPEDIREARVYYLKMVLHDWPDEQCKQILANLRPALKKGHSRILLNEIIIPETGAGWFETSVDMIMLCAHSAQERRESHWKSLVESVEGLKVANIWNVAGAVEKIIEIVPV